MATSGSSSSSNTDDFGEKDQIRAETLLSLNYNSDRRGDLAGRDEADVAAEALSRQYWECNVLDYEEKVVDGFYDVYRLSTDSATQGKMPSLAHLEANPGSSGFEAVMVNRTIDPPLKELLQVAQCIALDVPATDVNFLVQRLAEVVSEHMGGPVEDANMMLAKWLESNRVLRRSLHTSVLPIGSIHIGFSRHRALLFKVLADCMGLPCRLVKGIHYTRVKYGAVNLIKLNDEREFLVDLMAAPGTLIPADILSAKDTVRKLNNQIKILAFQPKPLLVYSRPKRLLGAGSSQNTTADGNSLVDRGSSSGKTESLPSFQVPSNETAAGSSGLSSRVAPSQLDNLSTSVVGSSVCKGGHGASAVGDEVRRNLNVVPYGQNSQEDSKNLSADLNPFQIRGTGKTSSPNKPAEIKVEEFQRHRNNLVSGRLSVPMIRKNQNPFNEVPRKKDYNYEEGILPKINRASNNYNLSSSTSTSSTASEKFYPHGLKPSGNANLSGKDSDARNALSGSGSPLISRLNQRNRPRVPMMWENHNPYIKVPGKKYYNYKEDILPKINCELNNYNPSSSTSTGSTASEKFYPQGLNPSGNANLSIKGNDARNALSGSGLPLLSSTNQPNRPPLVEDSSPNFKEEIHRDGKDAKFDMLEMVKEHENNEIGYHDRRKCTHDRFMGSYLKLKDQESRRSSVNSSTNSVGQIFDGVDVSESEIPWEDLVLGERVGLGSYGEVYYADWNGKEVAVKKLFDQDISGDGLLEFKREVKIMHRLRHPNIVMFMGAVTRPPNLSIVSEFLPRGSLFQILHRRQYQIDEKRRIKMAVDVATGMNYLHTSTPTIVHGDLKSQNLLVDKNWNVKVCDFGMSRLKHSTFLSSKSFVGTPEWMAPELLRCERSNEKCDVYSFGVILWELATLRSPWTGMNPMQVVGAVGFHNRRLEIPKEVDPLVARIIHECWQMDPHLRPSFAQLTVALKPLQRLVIPSHLDQPSSLLPQEISEKPDAASKEDDTAKADWVCRFCLGYKDEIAILACGHVFPVCHRCSPAISRCPFCRR